MEITTYLTDKGKQICCINNFCSWRLPNIYRIGESQDNWGWKGPHQAKLLVQNGSNQIRWFRTLTSWVLSSSQGQGLHSLSGKPVPVQRKFSNEIVSYSHVLICACCLQSCPCALAGRVWLCLRHIFPWGSCRQHVNIVCKVNSWPLIPLSVVLQEVVLYQDFGPVLVKVSEAPATPFLQPVENFRFCLACPAAHLPFHSLASLAGLLRMNFLSSRSLTEMLNSIGLSICPWGTQWVTSQQLDLVLYPWSHNPLSPAFLPIFLLLDHLHILSLAHQFGY